MKRFLIFLYCVSSLLTVSACGGYSQEEVQTRVQSAYEDGYSDGLNDGYIEGYTDGKIESIPGMTYDGSDLIWQYTPKSSCFYAVAYDEGVETLAVIFESNKTRTYLYYGFSVEDWDDFISSESLGSYYNAHIKGKYDGERIDDIGGTYFSP